MRELNKGGFPDTRNRDKPWRSPRKVAPLPNGSKVQSGGGFSYDKRDVEKRTIPIKNKKAGTTEFIEINSNVTGCIGDLVERDPTYWGGSTYIDFHTKKVKRIPNERRIKVFKGKLGKFGRPKKKGPPKGHICHRVGNPAIEYSEGMRRKVIQAWRKRCHDFVHARGGGNPGDLVVEMMSSEFVPRIRREVGIGPDELRKHADNVIRPWCGMLNKRKGRKTPEKKGKKCKK